MVRWRLWAIGLWWAMSPSDGWWQTSGDVDPDPPNSTCWEEPLLCLQKRVNSTVAAVQAQYATLTTWDSLAWTVLDTLLSGAGWLVFGQSWASVRTGCSLLLRVAFLMAICIVLHYFLSLAWPLCSLAIGTLLTVVWVVRAMVRCCGRVAFYTQRMAGGCARSDGSDFHWPRYW